MSQPIIPDEEIFQQIVESAPMARILVNQEARIVYLNNKTEQLFGYTKEELMGQSIDILIPLLFSAGHPRIKDMFLTSTQTKIFGEGGSLFGLKKNGMEFLAEIGLTQVVTAGGIWVTAAINDISEKKKFEEQKALFASIINSSEDAILSKTLGGIITSWNRGAEKIFGYAEAEIIGKHIFILIPPHLQNEETEIIEKIVKGESVQHYETERICKDGKIINVSLTISPITDFQGNIIGASKISRNITKEKEAEKKLIKANRLYAFNSQINQSIVHIQDRQTLFDKACEIATEIGKFMFAWVGMIDENAGKVNLVAHSGIKPSEFDIYDNLYYTRPDFLFSPLERAITTGKYALSNDLHNDSGMKNFKGQAKPRGYNSVMILPLKLAGKEIGAFCCASLDVNFFDTEEVNLLVEAAGDISFALDVFEKEEAKQQYEKKLEESEKQFRHTLDNMMEGIQIIDFDFRYIYINDSVAAHGRYLKEELIGYTMMEKYPGIEHTEVFEIIDRCMHEHTSQHLENEFVYPDKSTAWFELSIQPVPEGVFILTLDITQRKKAEEKTSKANRLYAFISQVNQSIVHAKDRQALFDRVCEIAIDFGKFKYAWIGLIDNNSETVNLVAETGIPVEYQSSYCNLSFKSPLLISSPLGKAITTGKCAYINDMLTDATVSNFKEFAEKRGYRSTIILPIKQSGNVVGVFCCNSQFVNIFDKEEIALLNEAADNISFALDVFEKEEAKQQYEKKLEDSELRLKEAQEVANIGSWEYNYEMNIIIWSEENCRIYGLLPDQNIQSIESFLSFIHPDDAVFVRTRLEQSHISLKDHSFYCRIIRKDGGIRHVYIKSRFKFDKEGKPIAIYGITYDVTEKRNAEERLEVVDVAFKYADTSIFIIKKDASFYDFNDAAYTRLGYTKDELMDNMTVLDIDPSINADTWPKHWQELREQRSTSLLSKHRRKDGTLLDVQTNLRMIEYKGLELNCALVTDVTEKKKTEEELLLNNAVLKKTNAELDRFIYSISHELRMPLTSIMGLQTLIKKEHLDNRDKGILELIKKSAFGMDEVLREILDYSRNTRIESKATSIDLTTLINGAFENSNFYQEGFSFDKRITLRGTVPFYADLVRIKIVVNNLVSNAIKYSKKDIVDAFIKINVVVDEAKMTMEISDNGIGIKEEYLPHIFKMFYRATTAVTGSGLGLYIVKESVEKLGGNITVESKFGEGTKFLLEIPNAKPINV